MSQMCPNCSYDNPDDATTCALCPAPLRGLLGKNTVVSERYNVVSVLGYGAMGAVYLANDTRLEGRRCAIKENRPDMKLPETLRAQSRDQFLAEASVLARLDHSRLPKVSDYFVEDNSEYLVMDYVEGDDLATVIERAKEPLAEATVLDWADQVLDVLEYLHNHEPQPIIHRDIKPANLRVNARGQVKLVDFGLVKLLDPNNPETKVELRGLGTPAYAPLEQFAGSQEHTDNRSDIYSLGATMYHLVTHLRPTEVHQRLLAADSLIPPKELNVNLSSQTQEAILKALAIYPNERFQSAEDMRAALAAAAEATKTAPISTVKKPAGPAPSGGRPAPVWLLAVLGVLFLLLVGGALYFFFSSSGNTEPPVFGEPVALGNAEPTQTPALLLVQPLSDAPAVEEETAPETSIEGDATDANLEPSPTVVAADTPTPEPTATLTSDAIPTPTPTPTASTPIQPDKIPPSSLVGTIAYSVFNNTDYDLYFGQVDGSGTVLFREHASQPAFSHDGNRITFHSWLNPWGLVAMELPDSELLLLADFVEDQLPTFTANGNEIIYLSRREGDRKSRLVKVGSTQLNSLGAVLGEGEYPMVGASGDLVFRGWGLTGTGIHLSDTSLNNPQPVTSRDEDTAPALSPDGSKVAFMSRRDGNWDIFVANVDGSEPNRITDNPGEDGLPVWSPDGQVIAFVSFRDDEWGVWASLPTGEDQRLLFKMEGSPDGLVGASRNASRGWTEERISWTE